MNKVSNRQKVYNAIKLMLIVLIAITLVFSLFRPDKTYAAGENTITVKKVSTVTVYVSGPGVVLESSNNNTDVYKVDQNSPVTFYAVNESRLFSKWNITDANSNVVNSSSDSMITLTVDKSLDVSVTRKDATTDDYGKYILDRYIIEDETDLIAVQNIVAGNGTNDDFAQFYEDTKVYDTKDEKDALAAAFRVGYFVVANNFTVYNEKKKKKKDPHSHF